MASGQKAEFTINAKDKTKRGLTSAQKNLKKTTKEAGALANGFRNIARATVVMEGPLGGTAGRVSAIATMLNSVNVATIAFGIGMTAMTAVMIKSMTAFSQWESQTLKINQLLEQTGTASGLTGKEIEGMAISIGRATLASADDVRAASAILLSFKSIATDAFERTLVVASDLAALTGQDLKQSVIQLGKALEDPATGMSALRRVGVSFTDSQKEMIVTMNKTGDVAGAQAEILGLLEAQLGGAGAAQGKGLAGAADLVSENWSLMLINLGKTGAGEAATNMLNTFGNVLEWVGFLLKDDTDLQKERFTLMDQIVAKTEELATVSAKSGKNAGDIRRIQLLATERQALIDRKEFIEEGARKEIADAREKGRVSREEIQKENVAQAKLDAQKAQAKIAEKALEKTGKEASGFASKLIAEEERFQTSLLTKSEQEAVFFAERLMKLQEFNEAGALSEEEADAAGIAARQLHEAKITEIKRTEGEKRAQYEARFTGMQVAATQTALSDIGSMMASSNKSLFNVGKASAIANALINTYMAVTKTMAATPYPWNIPLAIAQGAAGLVQVQKIKQTKMAGREFGGPVIGGRTYLVGERGPELFTSPRTGQIINNATTSNVGGQTNVFNITNVLENDEAFIQRNAVKIWDSIIDNMNENGLRFA